MPLGVGGFFIIGRRGECGTERSEGDVPNSQRALTNEVSLDAKHRNERRELEYLN